MASISFDPERIKNLANLYERAADELNDVVRILENANEIAEMHVDSDLIASVTSKVKSLSEDVVRLHKMSERAYEMASIIPCPPSPPPQFF